MSWLADELDCVNGRNVCLVVVIVNNYNDYKLLLYNVSTAVKSKKSESGMKVE